ncbi:MAG: hypothetical protein MK098_11720 [Marinovum sp.]|nr:hypothetical protein [Marinovum sp.]
MSMLAGPILALAHAPAPSQNNPILVIAPDAADVIAAAGGQVIGPTTAPLAALATGDAGFADRLNASSAWLVTDGQWVAELCGVTS